MRREAFIPKAVIDTGPLFTILTLNFIRQMCFSEQKQKTILENAVNDRGIIERPSRRENYLQLFHSIPTLLTTSHVIGELQGRQKSIKLHNKGLYGEDAKNFWLYSMELLQQKSLDERLLRLLDMYAKDPLQNAVCKIGPTDAALIELARQEACILLTDDERTLYSLASEVGVKCQLVKHLLDKAA